MKLTMKKAVMGVAVAATLGASAASADTLDFSYSGLFTMLTPVGNPQVNTGSPYYSDSTWGYGKRTQIAGTMSFDTTTGAGSGTIVPFDFMNGSAFAQAVSIDFQAIGDGFGNPGTLVLGNMLFNWSYNNGIPVSIVMDAAGLFGAISAPGFGVGSVVSGVGALPASNDISAGKIKIGAAPVATTTWNTTLVGAACTGSNGASCMGRSPSGALPLIADTIGGSPMVAGPFIGYNANFDITSLTVTNLVVDPVVTPIPAAAWLLGSGLVGMAGLVRRRKSVDKS